MNVLVVSNMGSKPSNPSLGLFVDNQVAALRRILDNVCYFKMTYNGDGFTHKLLKYPVFFFKFFLTHILSKTKYDIIHIHYYYPTIYAAFLYKYLRNRSVKVVVTCHGGDIYHYAPPNFLYRKLTYLVDHWIFTSEKLRERFYRALRNSSVICAGYNSAVYKYSGNDTKQYDCVLVGSLDYNKGIDRLIRLINECPSLTFAVAGKGPFQSELEKLEASVSNFKYFGSLPPEQLKNLVSSAHLLISLSRKESFGLVISEAHALGVPCIATMTDGSLTQIDNKQFLISQKPEELITDRLYKAIRHFIEKNEVQKQKTILHSIQSAERFSLTEVSNSIKRCYESLLR